MGGRGSRGRRGAPVRADRPAYEGAAGEVPSMSLHTRSERSPTALTRTTLTAGDRHAGGADGRPLPRMREPGPGRAAADPRTRSSARRCRPRRRRRPPPPRIASMCCRGHPRRSAPRRQAAAIRCLVNRARARAGLRPLRANRALARAAARHARDMGRRRFFSHTNTRGRSPAARARAAGWRGRRIGEALAFGCGASANALWIVRSWLNSPSHRAIVLRARYGQMGSASRARRRRAARAGRRTRSRPAR